MRPDIDAGPIDLKCRPSNGPDDGGLTGGCLFGAAGQQRLRSEASDSNGKDDQAWTFHNGQRDGVASGFPQPEGYGCREIYGPFYASFRLKAEATGQEWGGL